MNDIKALIVKSGEKNFPTYTSCMIDKRSGRCLMMLWMARIKVGWMMVVVMSLKNRLMMTCSSGCCVSRCIRIIRWCVKRITARTGMLMVNCCTSSVRRRRCWRTIRCTIVKRGIMFYSTGCRMYIKLSSESRIEWRWEIGKGWISYGTTTRTYGCIEGSPTDGGWRRWGRWRAILSILQGMRQIHWYTKRLNDKGEKKVIRHWAREKNKKKPS